MMTEWGLTPGVLALLIGGGLGAFYRAVKSPTQETWHPTKRVWGRRLPSRKTTEDIFIGAFCSVGIPKFADQVLDLLLPANEVLLKIETWPPLGQGVLALLLGLWVSWEVTVRGWVLREKLQGTAPEIKNANSALEPAKSVNEIALDERLDKAFERFKQGLQETPHERHD